MAAAFGEHLVLDVRGGDAGGDVELGGALDVEDVAVAAVHVDDHRWDVEVPGLHPFFRITNGHGQLGLAQPADGPTGGIGDLDTGIEVHIGRAQVADGKRVAAEVHGLEAVVHDQLGAHRVVDARTEEEGLGIEQPAHASTRVDETRGRQLEPLRQQGARDQLLGLWNSHLRHQGWATRCRDRVRSRPGIRTRRSRPGRAGSRLNHEAECCALPSRSWKPLYQLTSHRVQSFMAIGSIEKPYMRRKLAAISRPSASAASTSMMPTIRASLVAAIAASLASRNAAASSLLVLRTAARAATRTRTE